MMFRNNNHLRLSVYARKLQGTERLRTRRILSKAAIETLEKRTLLSFTVNTLSDDDTGSGTSGSLRWAIEQADAASENQVITFDSALTADGPVTISTTGLNINNVGHGSLQITGPTGPNGITIDGEGFGAISESYGSQLSLQNLTITDGGGISTNGTLSIENCTISGNQGSGIDVNTYGNVTVTDSTISGNTASQGGGIYNYGFVTLVDSTISGNTATYEGGGICSEDGKVTLINSTVSGNTAPSGAGGGISSSHELYITDSTIADNTGGGISSDEFYASLSGTIVADNNGPDLSGGGFIGTYNLIGDSSGSGRLSTSTSSHNLLATDPSLGTLGYYGGPTQTMPLLPGSPAIGGNGNFDDVNGNLIATDQRGISRAGSIIDIGAFQLTGSINAQGSNFTTYATADVSHVVATLVPSAILSNANFQATINWGDGSSSTVGTVASISSDSNAMAISGTHTYPANGSSQQIYTVTVTVFYYGGVEAAMLTPRATVNPRSEAGTAMDLTATATVNGSVDLAWLPDGLGETGFQVERSNGSSGWITVGTVSPTPISGDTLHFADTPITITDPNTHVTTITLEAGINYQYRIEGFLGSGSTKTFVSMSNPFAATPVPVNATFDPFPIDTVDVPINSATGMQSHFNLSAGVEYEIVASGYFYLGSLEAPHEADAQWTAFGTLFGNTAAQNDGRRLSRTTQVDLGIGINDSVNDSNKYPYWGTYSTSHTYAVTFMGTGAPITLNYHDEYYPDNVIVADAPSLQVQIFPMNPGPLTLTATPDYVNRNQIRLDWQGVIGDDTDIQVWRKASTESAFRLLHDYPNDGLNDGSGSDADSNESSGTTYQYQVIAYTLSGVQYSNIATATYRVGTPTAQISGGTTYDPNQLYTLYLLGQDNGGPPITSWQIDWGDSGSADNPPDIQTLSGNPSSVTHRFPTENGQFNISATAYITAEL
jgi:hypothetical protein